MKSTLLGLLGIAIVMATAIGYGFLLTGSPSTQRLRTQDNNRLEYLVRLADGVNAHYRVYGELPPDLEAVKNDTDTIPTFPLNEFTYTPKTQTTYEICTTFNTAREGERQQVYMESYGLHSAPHAAGLECYTLGLAQK